MNGASGRFNTNFTVMSSTFSTEARRPGMPIPWKYSQVPPETVW